MLHTRRYVIEIKDAETDAVVICRAADWADKEKRAAVVSVMRLAELLDIDWLNYDEPTLWYGGKLAANDFYGSTDYRSARCSARHSHGGWPALTIIA